MSAANELHCTMCKHDHAIGSVCGVCGHIRTPPAPMFKLEGELPRTPNAFNAETYELSPLHFRALGPGEEAMGPAVRKTGGCWSLEKSLRNKLREELRGVEKDREGNVLVPGVDVVMEIGEDPQQESDRFDKEWCRHILGRIGDAPCSTARWRLIQLDSLAGTGERVNVALIDRLFVLPYYRRRRIARTTLLNLLVDINFQVGTRGASVHRVSVVLPLEKKLEAAGRLLVGLGFQQAQVLQGEDPTGMWGAGGGGGGVGGGGAPLRPFAEFSLLWASVLPLLEAAHAAAEGVLPEPKVGL